MKRSSPLQRHTRLVGSAETYWAWQRRSQDTAQLKARTAPRKSTAGTGEHRARRLVRARSGGRCEIGIPEVCGGTASEFCHRVKRSQGGPWSASNGMDGCVGCHAVTTNTDGRRDVYERNGWVLKRHHDPTLTRVLHARHGWVWLDNTGGMAPAPYPNGTEEAA